MPSAFVIGTLAGHAAGAFAAPMVRTPRLVAVSEVEVEAHTAFLSGFVRAALWASLAPGAE